MNNRLIVNLIALLSVFIFILSGCKANYSFESLNEDYNQKALAVFDQFDGIIAICNYKTGELICCSCISNGENLINKLNFYSDNNEFLYGQFVPGSTMKIITTIAALRNMDKVHDLLYTCREKSDYLNGNISCQKSHGLLDLNKAFGYSGNCFYGNLALKLGRNQIIKTAESLGFNKKMNFNGIHISNSSFVLQNGDNTDFAWSSCGQASVTINPAHYLALISTIANNGNCPIPGMKLSISEKEAQKIHGMLRNNVESYYGDNRFHGLRMCGKTGTAEIVGQNSNSLFVGFSESEDAPYSLICIVKEGGGKINTAIEFSSQILQYIVENEGEGNRKSLI